MKVFICWSGRRSKEVAKSLHEWLPTVLDGLAPTYSPDIPKGERWFNTISQELSRSQAELICFTPENLESAWVYFEAGALFRETNKVFAFLYKVRPSNLSGPMSHFQSTEAHQDDVRKLIAVLTELMADKAPAPQIWQQRLTEQWPVFEERLRNVEPLTVSEIVPGIDQLFRRKTFREPLVDCKNQEWRNRYSGARETWLELKRWSERVRENAAPHMADYYDELVQVVDAYCMHIGGLLTEKRFRKRQDGKLAIEDAIAVPCEARRREILGLLNSLQDGGGAPILDESRLYRKLVTIEEKKAQLIQPFEARIKRGEIPQQIIPDGMVSRWEFDRIVYYLVQENRADLDLAHLCECVKAELEKVRAREAEGSLIPLHYAIRALERGIRKSRLGKPLSREVTADIGRVANRVKRYLAGKSGRDAGGHIKENLADLRKALNRNYSVE
ncbi:MAG TPA: TIR domain-containing protein [Nitrospiraceae bacterium]|nr:TIR domain-containing protein [Nitrospiraceae bacterium]